MEVFSISGAGLADCIFTTTMPGLPEVTWNVTRIERDAMAGLFGQPETILTSKLPPMGDINVANIDWGKVNAIMRIPSVVATPVLSVVARLNDTNYRIPVDGNHRLCARVKLGLPDFQTFVVPTHLEQAYRVSMGVVR